MLPKDTSLIPESRKDIIFKDPHTRKLEERIIYGELINRFSEVWAFSLYSEYVYLEAENIIEAPKF